MNFLVTIIAITLEKFPDILWASEKCAKECSGKLLLNTIPRNWIHIKILKFLQMRK
jgi:hypothetical protein